MNRRFFQGERERSRESEEKGESEKARGKKGRINYKGLDTKLEMN